jgi:hypothetical protein
MDKFAVWTNEFFNRSVHGVYDLAEPTPGALPETKVGVDAATGRIPGVDAPFVLASQSLELDEEPITVDAVKGLAVYRVVRPLGVRSATTGISPDSWAGARASYTLYRCAAGDRLSVTVAGDSKLIRTESTLTAVSGGASTTFVVPYKQTKTVTVPLTPVAGRCVVRFRISPVAEPAVVEPGSTDTRALGLRFLRIRAR